MTTVASKMEQETLFTASKWDILKMLSAGSKSPLQLAKLSNTSVANISQQLRLLEMAGLVQSKRISNRDRGQPRLLYSLVGNHSFLISTSTDFVEKKFLQLSEYNKVILKIWFLEDATTHYFLEKAFWSLEENISRMDALLLDTASIGRNDLRLLAVSDNPELRKILKKMIIKNPAGEVRGVQFDVCAAKELTRSSQKKGAYYALYDPSNILNSSMSDSEQNMTRK